MLRNFFVLFLLCFCLHLYGQNDTLLRQICQRISALQLPDGNFPSYISNRNYFTKNKQDDNFFFAALINYTFGNSSFFKEENNRLLVDSILQKTQLIFPHFQNKNDRLSYNFWRTDTPFVFRYTWWIRLLKKNTSLPDDMDDTVLSLMAQNADSTRAAEAHNIMQAFVNKNKKTKTIDKNYRSLQAYSVWYGKKFPPVFDVCVLSNILFFVQQYHLAWTAADSASLQVIVQSIESDDFLKQPLSVSPYYGNTSIILYHLARLMSYGKINQLEALKAKLIKTAALQLSHAKTWLEKVILSSALIKWNNVTPPLQLAKYNELIQQTETDNLPFFIGNIPSYFSSFYKHLFYKKNWLLFYHYCPAFNDALLLEYLMLQQRTQ